jgi:hypothetical protein
LACNNSAAFKGKRTIACKLSGKGCKHLVQGTVGLSGCSLHAWEQQLYQQQHYCSMHSCQAG